MIKEKAYAKINLGLEVGPVREDGFHDFNSIMVPIDLYDELTFEENENGILLIDNTNVKTEDNFVYKAAKLFLEKYKINTGVTINLNKVIPDKAGLGGGSSDAAATLRGLNRLFDTKASLDELAVLSRSLGSDMPFCVYSRPAFCTGHGEIVKLLDFDVKPIPLCIVKPPYGLSTKEVYNEFQFLSVNIHEEQFENIKEALKQGDLKLLMDNLFNDLEAPAFKLKPELSKLAETIKDLGYYVRMTGSGTGLLVFNDNNDFLKIHQNILFHTIIDATIME